MPYLIDGNNVMAQRVGWHRDKSAARRRLLDEVAAFAEQKRVKATVVFDGAPEEFFKDGSSYKGVKLFYAERGSNADERIKAMVEASRERRTLIVVTSDRALAAYVQRCGAQTLRSGEFRQRLDELADDKPPAEEQDTVPDAEMKNWMRYFGVEEDE
ncbi:MAG: NYN domain-containing protein [Pyrinomonadaceae bacterium]|nr:NYN domain-containing protein [Pyrinomonadaceae bacterium]